MRARLLLLSAVVLWGWTFVATKILVTELGPIEIFALRLALGLPFLGGILLLRRVRVRFERRDLRALLAGSAIFTVHFLIQIQGLTTTTASNTGWIISVSPLVLAVLSFAVLGERLGRSAVAGIVVATFGVLLLVSRGHIADFAWLRSTGDWLVLGSAVTWACYTVTTRDLTRRRNPLAVTFGILLVAAAITTVLLLWAATSPTTSIASADLSRVRHLSPRGIVALLYLAVPGLALGQWFWQEGVAALGASRAGVFLYLEPIATILLAVPLLGEPFGPVTALGGALVLAGVYLGQRRR
jgi:drug/metabolite transporter (DMT)-like permease